MPVDEVRGRVTVLDILDRVLDRGIVIDSWSAWSVGGVHMFTVQAWMIVTSIDSRVLDVDAVGEMDAPPVARPSSPRRTRDVRPGPATWRV
jgi:hypothetical protein